jgi:2-polyprenyl-3-methyl-5-hydroxy-6-metoxy-1,4-benzoquinol methylase
MKRHIFSSVQETSFINTSIKKKNSTGIKIPGDWFKHWFDSSFYRRLYANRDENEASGFVDELLKELQPAPGSQILDLGCGNGRHSKHLASKGFHVTGLDLASSSITIAKRSETPNLKFSCHDMRVPFGKNCFHYIFNFFTSFGYFKTSAEDDKVISNMAQALKPGGTLVMDYINSSFAEKNLIPAETKENDGIRYFITRWTDEKYFFKKIAIENTGSTIPVEFTEQVKKFSPDELCNLMAKHNLHVEKVYGDYALNEYNSETSARMILFAKKK